MIIKWNAEHALKVKFQEPGISFNVDFRKGVQIHVPDKLKEIIEKKLSDSIKCKYCEILPDKKKLKKGNLDFSDMESIDVG